MDKNYWYYCAVSKEGFIDGGYDTDLDEFPVSEILMYLMGEGFHDVYILNQYPISKEEYDNLEQALRKRVASMEANYGREKKSIHSKGVVKPRKVVKPKEVK